jgi:hypothetical protein
MKVPKWIPLLFAIAALYDGILGLVFVGAPGYPFELFGVEAPYHMGFVQFPGALLLIFAILFIDIARNPVSNRNLIVYGILLKIAYCSVTGWYWIASTISEMWKPFCIIDLVMAVLFVVAYRILAPAAASIRST